MGVLEIIVSVFGSLVVVGLFVVASYTIIKMYRKEMELYDVRIAKEKEIVELLMRYNGRED